MHTKQEMMSTLPVISQHIFMFPFTIEVKDVLKNSSGGLELETLSRLFGESGWEKTSFKPFEDEESYSEYVYFHKYVRETLFETEPPNKKRSPICHYFVRDLASDDSFTLVLKPNWNRNEIKEYKLKISHVSLRIFETGIGILSIELLNYQYKKYDDVLYINDFGRRIYPQFLSNTRGISETKESFLPERVILKCGTIECVETFDVDNYLNTKLINPEFACYIKELLCFKNLYKKGYDINPVIDDRMFLLSWYGDDVLSSSMKKNVGSCDYGYEESKEWYKYVFVDNDNLTCQNHVMLKNLIKEHTYNRWVDYGTLYGISRYSIVCLSDRSSFATNVVREHMQRHYFQMAAITLAQRASILKFSGEVADISGELDKFIGRTCLGNGKSYNEKEFQRIAEKVKQLHASLIRFTNRLWFPEVTAQEQGIELYGMLIGSIGIREQIEEINAEIKELYEFIELEYEKIRVQQDRKLNMLAAFSIPIAISSGIFSITAIDDLFRNSEINYVLLDGMITKLGPVITCFIILTFILYILSLGYCFNALRWFIGKFK